MGWQGAGQWLPLARGSAPGSVAGWFKTTDLPVLQGESTLKNLRFSGENLKTMDRRSINFFVNEISTFAVLNKN